MKGGTFPGVGGRAPVNDLSIEEPKAFAIKELLAFGTSLKPTVMTHRCPRINYTRMSFHDLQLPNLLGKFFS